MSTAQMIVRNVIARMAPIDRYERTMATWSQLEMDVIHDLHPEDVESYHEYVKWSTHPEFEDEDDGRDDNGEYHGVEICTCTPGQQCQNCMLYFASIEQKFDDWMRHLEMSTSERREVEAQRSTPNSVDNLPY